MKKLLLTFSIAFVSMLFVLPMAIAQPRDPLSPTGTTAGYETGNFTFVDAGVGMIVGAEWHLRESGTDFLLYKAGNSPLVFIGNSGEVRNPYAWGSSVANAADGIVFQSEGEIQWPDTKIAEVGSALVATAPSGFQSVSIRLATTGTSGMYEGDACISNSSAICMRAGVANTGTNYAHAIVNFPALTGDRAMLRIVPDYAGAPTVDSATFQADGDAIFSGVVGIGSFTDDSATTGSRTVNKQCGINAFAAGATTFTVTNSYVTAATAVLCTINSADGTATLKHCATAAGSFTATTTAVTTGITKLGWCVIGFL